MDYTIDARSRIQSHDNRLRYWIIPIGKEEWHMFLTNIIGDFIQWNYSWIASGIGIRTYRADWT